MNTPLASALLLITFLVMPTHLRAEVATEGAEPGKWTMDFDAAVKVAKEKDLPLLLNFTGSDWCGWCKLMDRNVFGQKDWKEYAASRLMLVTIDFPQNPSIVPEKFLARNSELKAQFKVEGYPTYVLLDSDAKTEIGRFGATQESTPAIFIEGVDEALLLRPAALEAKVKALGRVEGDRYRAAIKESGDAQKELEAWIQTSPPRNAENEAKYEKFLKRIEQSGEALKKF